MGVLLGGKGRLTSKVISAATGPIPGPILSRAQSKVFMSRSRFRVLVAGRRFGKTFLSGVELLRAAAAASAVRRDALCWYVAPTYRQAKEILWRRLRLMAEPITVGKPNETDLSIQTSWGAVIALRGGQEYDRLRGPGLDFLVLDEWADQAPEAWREVLRPMLSDRGGGALFIGTPKGFNHFYDLYRASASLPDWARFSYTTLDGGWVAPSELEAARRELDEGTFRQEYEASFENLTSGRVYYAFERAVNVRPVEYRPKETVLWAMDFNVTPMCSVIAQRTDTGLAVLDEIVLRDSHTLEACEVFMRRIQPWIGRENSPKLSVSVYGDAAGAGRQTAGAGRSDWQIVREFFARVSDRVTVSFRVPAANPFVRDRVNAVNALLKNHAGERRLVVDPRCKELIADLEHVTWKEDAAGNTTGAIDKADPKRSHVSDALGYLVARDWPLKVIGGPRPEYLGV